MSADPGAAAGIRFRRARRDDVPAIVRLLADDALGAGRERVEDPLPSAYLDAFAELDADPRETLLVAEDADGTVVGCLQLTETVGLSSVGMRRATIESVRIAASLRGRGVGAALVGHAVAIARDKGCGQVQLTSHVSRRDAHRFYERLGFTASHVGMKLVF